MEDYLKCKPPEILSGCVPAYIQVPTMSDCFGLFKSVSP